MATREQKARAVGARAVSAVSPGPLTVIVLCWTGWRPSFTSEHVNALKRMLAVHLAVPHRLVCATDNPAGMACETVPIWTDPEVTNKPTPHDTYRRLKLFSAWAARMWPGWILSLDLDLIICNDITPLITWDDLRILKGGVSRYRGGMFLHKTGTRTKVWDSFDPMTSPWEVAKYHTKGQVWKGSDQGWLSVCLPYEKMYTNADGVYVWNARLRAGNVIPPNARIIFPTGTTKPWSTAMRTESPVLWKEYRKWL